MEGGERDKDAMALKTEQGEFPVVQRLRFRCRGHEGTEILHAAIAQPKGGKTQKKGAPRGWKRQEILPYRL